MTDPTPVPTQVVHPWRATVRSVFQFAVALLTLLPLVAAGVYQDVDQAPAVVTQVLVVAGAVTKVMALPAVEDFLRQFIPFLSAEPKE